MPVKLNQAHLFCDSPGPSGAPIACLAFTINRMTVMTSLACLQPCLSKLLGSSGRIVRIIVSGCLGLIAFPAIAASGCADLKGTTDHPLIPRFEGACIMAAVDQSFAATDIAVSKPVRRGAKWTAERIETAEGKTSTRLYRVPVGSAPLEVFRNYVKGVQARSFKIDYECTGKTCGGGNAMMNFLTITAERKAELKTSGGKAANYAFAATKEQNYLAATGPSGERLVVFVGQHGKIIKELTGQTIVYARVIQPAVLTDRLIDAGAMAEEIERSGRIALRNIYFDTGKASLKSDSDAALSEIAKLLGAQSGLSLYVVGHTDSTGQYEFNLNLSQARAASVVQALVSQYQVDPKRLQAAGVGPLSPAASNRDEAGQAENRRVELVAR